MKKANNGEMKKMKNKTASSTLWVELKAGNIVKIDNIAYYTHVSKKEGDKVPSLYLSSGVIDIDGKLRVRANSKIPPNKEGVKMLFAEIEKILPYAIKMCVAETPKASASPSKTSTPVNDEVPSWAKAMMEGIGQLGKNQQKINTRLNAIEGKK